MTDNINKDTPETSEKSSANRPDFKTMPQPVSPSQRFDDRITLRPGGHVSLRYTNSYPQVSTTTSRPAATGASGVRIPVTDDVFVIGGHTYTREAVLSSTTGEAELLLVTEGDNRYVLKLYYRGYYPSAEVLDILKRESGNSLVVDVIDYGVWTSQSGEERFAVVMPYYSGGILKAGEYRGRGDALEAIAIKAIESINFCHQHGILHKDIKPDNLIYTDDTHQHLVLADFGIASTFTRDMKGDVIPFVNVNQNRTSIYASPEIFNQTVQRSDGRIEVEYSDVKSDYFALGMTLLALWMGEAPFALVDERSLLKLKRGERSGLPYPDDIPAHTRNLIKGLNIADPKQRWGYAEFEKWRRGEDEPVITVRNLRKTGLRILFNGSKGQVATSLDQLAEFMLFDPTLGEEYLYSGKVSAWMAEAGLPEWQARIDSIVLKLHPTSRRSGLLTACYTMNPDLPFIGIKGQRCYNNLQIARELTRNADQYSMLLRDPQAPLYVYFSSHSMDIGGKYRNLFRSNPWLALWRMAYTLSPECEFPFWSTTRNSIVWCATIEDLVNEYASSSQDRYAAINVRTSIGKYTPLLLEDESFLLWLFARDPDLADEVRVALANEKSRGADLYTYIFFLLDPGRNFFYEKTTSSFYTLAHLGAMINRDLVDYTVIGRHNNNQHFYNEQHRRTEQLAHYRDSKFYYYLKSRGDYKDTFDYIDRCFDMHSKENKSKMGPYSSRLATLKVCHAFAGSSFYYFPVSDTTVTDVAQLDDVPVAEQKEELRHGFLLEWLAVQYQENPAYDNDDEYTYERNLMLFMERLERIDPNYPEVVKFNKCRNEVDANAVKLRTGISKIIRLKTVLLSFAAVIAVMIAVMIWGGVYNLPNDDTFSYNWRTVTYVAVPLFVLMIIPPVQNFVNDLTKGFLGSPLLFAVVISNVIVVGWELLRLYLMPYAYYSLPAIYGLFLLSVLYSCFVKRRLKRRKYKACIYPDFNTSCVEPLRFTWDDSYDPYREFDSSVIAATKEYSSMLKSLYKKLMNSVKINSLWMVVLVIGFCLLSVPVSHRLHEDMPWLWHDNNAEQFDQSDKDVALYICDASKSVSVRDKPDKGAKIIGAIVPGTFVEVVGFNADYAKVLFDGKVAYVLKEYLSQVKSEE